jgi:hypothetical protein
VATDTANKTKGVSAMETVLIQKERERRDGATTEPVVTATDITRRYGEGDTSVDALRGVSLDVASES